MEDKVPEKRDKSAAEIRKINKPLMEKKRRERINQCLNQLKVFLMETTKKDSSYYSKLEKADILEMTVKYLKGMQRQQLAAAIVTDPKIASKYTAGYSQCANEVTRYLGKIEGFSPELRNRLLTHLAGCMQKVTTSAVTSQGQNVQQVQLPVAQSLGFQVAPPTLPQSQSQSDVTSCVGSPLPSVTTMATVALPGGQSGLCMNAIQQNTQNLPVLPVQLIPAKLPSGDTVFLLTNTQSVPTVATHVVPSSMSVQIPASTTTPQNVCISNLMTNIASTATVAVVPPNVHGCKLSPSSVPTDLSLKSENRKEFDDVTVKSDLPVEPLFESPGPGQGESEASCSAPLLSNPVQSPHNSEDENNNRVTAPPGVQNEQHLGAHACLGESGPSGTGSMWRPW